jgi:hypothetical protein
MQCFPSLLLLHPSRIQTYFTFLEWDHVFSFCAYVSNFTVESKMLVRWAYPFDDATSPTASLIFVSQASNLVLCLTYCLEQWSSIWGMRRRFIGYVKTSYGVCKIKKNIIS